MVVVVVGAAEDFAGVDDGPEADVLTTGDDDTVVAFAAAAAGAGVGAFAAVF